MGLEGELKQVPVTNLEMSHWISVSKEATVKEVVQQMRDERIRCALITEEGKLAGIFTDRDVLDQVVGKPDNWVKPIGEVMTRSPKSVPTTATASQALNTMVESGIRNLPVVDQNGMVAGNLGQRSVVRYLSDRFQLQVANNIPGTEPVGHGG